MTETLIIFAAFVVFQNKNFQCLKLLNNAKFLLFYHMVYGKKDLDLLDILYLACCYVSLIYKFMYMLKNFVLAVGSVSDRSSVKCSAIFKKCQNPETSKLLYLESILVIV